MWRARNPDNPRSVAAQNERSTRRFVPFASSANLVPELKEANEKRARRRETYFHQAALEGAAIRPVRKYHAAASQFR
jgi:hypothetical protein